MSAASGAGKKADNSVCLVVDNATAEKIYPLEEGENLVGRWDPDAVAFPEVDLTEVDSDFKVSRKHAIIERHGMDLTLTDIGSRNGTFLKDGTQLEQGVAHKLLNDEQFAVAKVKLRVRMVPAHSVGGGATLTLP